MHHMIRLAGSRQILALTHALLAMGRIKNVHRQYMQILIDDISYFKL